MSIADDLERLQALHAQGALDAQEYAHAKARLLAEQGLSPAADTAASASADYATSAGGAFLRRLARSRRDRWLGGVCGGFGHHSELPSWVWRLLFCLVSLYFGAGILIYLLLWLLLPLEPA